MCHYNKTSICMVSVTTYGHKSLPDFFLCSLPIDCLVLSDITMNNMYHVKECIDLHRFNLNSRDDYMALIGSRFLNSMNYLQYK